MDQFMMGAIAMASFVAGLFFLRYWRDTGDRLFVIFGTAFWILGGTRIALAMTFSRNEDNTYLYWLRLLAFALILVAIIDKNRPWGSRSAKRSEPALLETGHEDGSS
ncbi:MAG: hypothetical protein HY000_32575 [Planctomycetes bacterium]|nr:hypothetical protein [Planctomycetota bacterium]